MNTSLVETTSEEAMGRLDVRTGSIRPPLFKVSHIGRMGVVLT